MSEKALVPMAQQGGPPQLDILTLGRVLSQSGYFQDARDEAKAITKILYGQEIGIGPVASLMNIEIIQGKPCPKPALMAALIQRSGRFAYRVRESTDQACRIEFFEGAQPLGIASFTMDDARKAKLADKDTWKQYPSDMLFARAMSRGARRFCPGIFLGAIYAPEELAELSGEPQVDPTTGEVIEEEPESQEAALLRTQAFAFAAAREAGINTKDLPAMRRVASVALDRDVPQLRGLSADERNRLGHFIRENPEAARGLAKPPEDETESETTEPLTLAAVAQAEIHETYAQAKGF